MDATFPVSAHQAFTALYANNDDPWNIDCGWYEQRKRAVLLACLPREHFDVIFEPGCGTGALSAALAARCGRLIACDIAPRAIALAQQRLVECGNVELSCLQIPDEWPAATAPASIDCVVISELAYFLAPDAQCRLLAHVRTCLKPDGVLVACHWNRDFAARTTSTASFHAQIAAATGLQRLVQHAETDFLLEVWCGDPRSVAQREGRT
jgi:SAM-dependent methyltransferase